MNILINFSTLKAGGGQNVAMNFLYEIFELDLEDKKFFYFVAESSQPHIFLQEENYENYFVVPSNPVKRILFDLFKSKDILRNWNINIIYSYFGMGLFPKKYLQVSGSADSNLFFPEIDFWHGYEGLALLKRKLVDKYRIYGLQRANAIVFENNVLENRAKEIYKFKETITIKPSINMNFNNDDFQIEQKYQDIKKGLFLCGWHLNKNIMLIPKIAYHLKQKGINFQFILTAPLDNSLLHKEFTDLVKKYDVEDMCLVVGQVKKEQLKSLYNQIDFVFLLSKLESFSNNIIESWYFKKPLIVSNEEWAKGICEDSAYYVNRDDAKEIASQVIELFDDTKKQSNLIENGIKSLKNYPNIKNRILEEMEYLEYVYEKYN